MKMPLHNQKLEKLQEEVIEIQLRIRDLEQQRFQLRKQLNGKLLRQVKSIGSLSSQILGDMMG
jgi:predicted  nucleic acid-binding Zn-ribbon protein